MRGKRKQASAKTSPDVDRKSGHEPNTGMRLNRALAQSGLCARRKADELIFAGRIAVNGRVEKNPATRVFPQDTLACDGKPVAGRQKCVCVLLNKPVGVVCTVSDPQGRPTVLDLLPAKLRGLRLYPIGRLDFFSEGLLLLTNDGELALRLAHPRYGHEKHYEVLIRGEVPESALEIMRRGMVLADGAKLAPVDARREKSGENTCLRLVLRQGVNRQIRRMCADLGLIILKLKRTAVGKLGLGNLAAGKTRLLAPDEVAELF